MRVEFQGGLMKQKKRVSFDVPLEEHIFLKVECAKAQIALRDLMRDVFHKTVEELKKKNLKEMLSQGFQESYEGKSKPLTDEDLDKWEKTINES
jgi:hypothetical protein